MEETKKSHIGWVIFWIVLAVFIFLVFLGMISATHDSKKSQAQAVQQVQTEGTASGTVPTTVVVQQQSQPNGWFFPYWIGYMMAGGGNYSSGSTYNSYNSYNSVAPSTNSDAGSWGPDTSSESSWGSSESSGGWGDE